jgi:hypothetical protein
MRGQRRTPVPGIAGLATIVVIGGVGLGLLISELVGSELKPPSGVESQRADRENEAVLAKVWPSNAPRMAATGDLAGTLNAGANDQVWVFIDDPAQSQSTTPSSGLEDIASDKDSPAVIAKDAAPVVAEPSPEIVPQERKSSLNENGLY